MMMMPNRIGGSAMRGAGRVGPGLKPQWLYVNSATGNDTNSGLTPAAPKQTLGSIPRQDGVAVRLMAGGVWRESLDLSAYNGVRVEGYGDFVGLGLPMVRGDDTIVGTWLTSVDRADANTNVYSISWTHSITIGARNLTPWVFENDADMVMASSLANCQATPGTFWHDVATSPVILYVHPTGSTNANTNGRVYSATKRHEVVRVGESGIVRYIWAHAAGNTLGSIIGTNHHVFDRCLATGNPLHAINGGGNFVRRKVVGICPTNLPNDTPLILEYFDPDLMNGIGLYEGCYAIGPATKGLTDVVGFGGHNTSGGQDMASVTYRDCAAVGCTMDTGNTTSAIFERVRIDNGSILIGLKSDGTAANATVTDAQIIVTALATGGTARGYVMQTAQGGAAPWGALAVDGLRCHVDTAGFAAVFNRHQGLTVTRSIINLGAGTIGSDGAISMDSAALEQHADWTYNIVVSPATSMLNDLRNFDDNGGTLVSDYNQYWVIGTNGTNGAGYRCHIGGTLTTRYTMAAIKADFAPLEANSVGANPGLASPATGDFTASNVAISGGGLARPGVTFLPKITTRAEAIAYILA